MNSPDIDKLFETDLLENAPIDALWKFAKCQKSLGVTQEVMINLFERHREIHSADEDETKLNAILDVMDLIVGFCSQTKALYPSDDIV